VGRSHAEVDFATSEKRDSGRFVLSNARSPEVKKTGLEVEILSIQS
jgi:hypothetical protein